MKRTVNIEVILDSGLAEEAWWAFVGEVEQLACDLAAASADDSYEVAILSDPPLPDHDEQFCAALTKDLFGG